MRDIWRFPKIRGTFIHSRGVITAHLLVQLKSQMETLTWDVQDDLGPPLERDWVQACLEGRLMYPARKEKCYLHKVLNWRPSANVWHWGPQSVTHMFSDLEKYDMPAKMANVPQSDMDEGGPHIRTRVFWGRVCIRVPLFRETTIS